MKRMQLLDYGRFFAAISVVAFHYFFNGIHNGKISSISYIHEVVDFVKYGYLGVEFFFMISGYVIFFSAKNRSASQFAVSRAVRLYPAFWAAIIFTSFFAIFWGGGKMAVSPSLVLTNFTMVSPLFGKGFVDGVYWTLIYELKFYLLVLALLLLGAKNKLESIFLLWPIAIAIATYYKNDSLPYLGGYFCYFSAGVILAIIKERKALLYYVPLLLILSLCVYFSAGKASGLTESKGVFYSESVIGCIVTLFFVFFIVASSKRGAGLNLYGSQILGALTYPLYLIHAHFGYMFISQFATEDNKIAIYALTLFIVISIAFLIHVLVENKFSNVWKKLFSHIVGKPIGLISRKSAVLVRAYNNRVN
ncbi:acyltransferase [Methylovulum psychrotolerans]|uniref:acyltransferase family protein n=1 Tax=Methylovulum psychrotolerans TaxID=1704499 RepID=UPI001BFEFBB8|nr:acyltransferase [Methylovulum psychrotolerans]MBT9097170.1 acyltransferase [Methylovulum psychrotolerans]